ncbi:hypothetical protein GTW43_01055 [Streptomyces sp. SID5785]|uniref:hypothetical protein n=1 Tax=Streptomyces sp. SID5785 TaxID=2690309 RepID=UPI0013617A7B|nr:hypothetical protein [Streptomyces sp. SID5785]MZD03578.1 hypothetical protein [Streptomyces sp. SID5785]MZD03676.1 hypothetical protein [Streptomyces sp. SID5785]
MTGNRTKTVTIAIILVVVVSVGVMFTAFTPGRDDSGGHADAARSDGRERVDLLARVARYTAPFDPDSGYRSPSSDDRATVARAVGLLVEGHREQAEQALSDVDFTLGTVVDEADGRRYTEIADRSDEGPAPRGWGRVYVADDGTPERRRWMVQVPHPVADRHTERVGVGVLRGTPGGILLIAGAHRKAGRGNASDVAHRRDTVFDAVADELVRRSLPAVQVHGFADASARHDVVASTGRGSVARGEGRDLADALRDDGFAVCRAWARSCPLEGRSNVQGRAASRQRVPFLHVELSNRIRTDAGRTDRVVAAFGRVTDRWRKGGRG